MKLITRINIQNLLISSLFILIAGLALYHYLTKIIDEEISERLVIQKTRIAQQIEKNGTYQNLPPIYEVKELPFESREDYSHFNDLFIYDSLDQDEEYFRELIVEENINGKRYQIIVRQIILEPHDYIYTIGYVIFWVLISLILLIFITNYFSSKVIWKTFNHNLDLLKKFNLNHDVQFKESKIKEFQELNKELGQLLKKIKLDYLNLKEFSENASHEIQTPVAIIQNQLEECLQDLNLSSNQSKLITDSLKNLKKLSSLNESLLLLSKLENKQFQEKEKVNLKALIEEQIEFFQFLFEGKNIQVELDLKNCELNANSETLQIMIRNLFNNAIKHNIENGKINMELRGNEFILSNTSDILLEEPELMFDRFKKANQSSNSTGLGLSLIKQICDNHGWEITYVIQNNLHIFKITF
ncbi:MAG: HAMP domain-containing histidine kinase [Crocinitomicaceae bacterium]|nr:HAMP domain-containing histidine kinase [Crocinitomicaceae bacterium]